MACSCSKPKCYTNQPKVSVFTTNSRPTHLVDFAPIQPLQRDSNNDQNGQLPFQNSNNYTTPQTTINLGIFIYTHTSLSTHNPYLLTPQTCLNFSLSLSLSLSHPYLLQLLVDLLFLGSSYGFQNLIDCTNKKIKKASNVARKPTSAVQ